MGADSEQTRRTILRAARDVIAECGYPAATFQQIATRAGVSRPTLHYYFGTREQVYDVLLREVHGQMAACVRQARGQTGLRSRLAAFTEEMQRFSAEDPVAMRFLVSARLEQRRGPHRHDAAHLVVSSVHAFYDAIAADAVRHGELGPDIDTHAVADMLASLFWGMAFHAGFIDGGGNASIVARQLLQLFETGLLNSRVGDPVDA